MRKAIKYLSLSFFRFLKFIHFDFEVFNRFYFRFLMRERRMNARWMDAKPYIDDLNMYTDYVPDRYSLKLAQYKKDNSFFTNEGIRTWVNRNFDNNAGDLTRYFFLNLCFDTLLSEGLKGNVAELGVYRGNSASLLSRYARKTGQTCYLFDTFDSFDARDLEGADADVAQAVFSDTSLDQVKALVGEENTVFVQGYFPESLSGKNIESPFVFVHIDCDLEKPFKAALDFFYPRMVKGGYIVMHDYSSLCWPGATIAVDAFFADKPEYIVPVPDKSGTVVVRKV